LDEFVHENSAVAANLKSKFLIMKVNYSDGNRTIEFLTAYPKVPAYVAKLPYERQITP
jgi:hypothetical protein